jgi:hypothetical protein
VEPAHATNVPSGYSMTSVVEPLPLTWRAYLRRAVVRVVHQKHARTRLTGCKQPHWLMWRAFS